MDPLTIMLLAQGIPAIAQTVTGAVQNRKSNRLAEGLTDPMMSIPKSAQEALDLARQNTTSRYMSGYDTMQNKIGQQTASAIGDVTRTARSPQDAIAAITAITANNQDRQLDLGIKNAQDYERRLGVLGNELDQMAGWENKVWETNVMEPFLRDSAAASALKNASMNNTYQGLKGITNALGIFGMMGGFTPSRTASEGLTKMSGTSNPIPTLPVSRPQGGLKPNTPLSAIEGLTPEQVQQLMSALQSIN